MTELDVESALRVDLKRCRSAYDQLERTSLRLTEDRDRLRTAVVRHLDECHDAIACVDLRAALEGRDG